MFLIFMKVIQQWKILFQLFYFEQYIYLYLYMHTHTHAYINIYIYIYIYIYISAVNRLNLIALITVMDCD